MTGGPGVTWKHVVVLVMVVWARRVSALDGALNRECLNQNGTACFDQPLKFCLTPALDGDDDSSKITPAIRAETFIRVTTLHHSNESARFFKLEWTQEPGPDPTLIRWSPLLNGSSLENHVTCMSSVKDMALNGTGTIKENLNSGNHQGNRRQTTLNVLKTPVKSALVEVVSGRKWSQFLLETPSLNQNSWMLPVVVIVTHNRTAYVSITPQHDTTKHRISYSVTLVCYQVSGSTPGLLKSMTERAWETEVTDCSDSEPEVYFNNQTLQGYRPLTFEMKDLGYQLVIDAKRKSLTGSEILKSTHMRTAIFGLSVPAALPKREPQIVVTPFSSSGETTARFDPRSPEDQGSPTSTSSKWSSGGVAVSASQLSALASHGNHPDVSDWTVVSSWLGGLTVMLALTAAAIVLMVGRRVGGATCIPCGCWTKTRFFRLCFKDWSKKAHNRGFSRCVGDMTLTFSDGSCMIGSSESSDVLQSFILPVPAVMSTMELANQNRTLNQHHRLPVSDDLSGYRLADSRDTLTGMILGGEATSRLAPASLTLRPASTTCVHKVADLIVGGRQDLDHICGERSPTLSSLRLSQTSTPGRSSQRQKTCRFYPASSWSLHQDDLAHIHVQQTPVLGQILAPDSLTGLWDFETMQQECLAINQACEQSRAYSNELPSMNRTNPLLFQSDCLSISESICL